ncbi:MAG TPA: LysR substrate-binding domain-containing protein [Candidatus Baltobacteraceae bacterium]|nr:LysR substrate-binding domain-containing protein [Candidatus Baltobacteraceae bacterium]
MELRHLRYFIAAAEEENVSRAALKLHVSQPGISRQIKDLEDEIGFQLFERSAKSLKLTEAGKIFLAEAKTILQRADDAVKNARAVDAGAGGELHVGYAPSLTVKILPQALRAFQMEFPKVRVSLHDLSTEEMLSKLRAGKLHLALTVQPLKKSLRDLEFKTLAQYAACVAVAPKHPLAKLKSVTLAQLAGEPLIGYNRDDYPDYHEYIARVFAPVGQTPRVAEEHDGITSIITAVESGRGYALVPEPTICMAGPRVKILPLKPDGEKICVGAIWKKGEASPLVEKFVAAAGEEN